MTACKKTKTFFVFILDMGFWSEKEFLIEILIAGGIVIGN